MMRRSAWLLLVAGAVFTNLASAVGLGELKLNSALNQPLNAEIKLLNTGDLSKNQLLPNLASHEDFARAGVERVFFLTGLKFDVEFKSNGDVVINMTSDKIVREPFLNFLVEIHWPNGRIQREYTILLDPPLFAEAPPAPIRQAGVATAKPAAAPAPLATTPTRAQPRPAPAPRSTPSATRGGDKVVIKKNDTLWGIARDNRPDSDLSIRQTMMAIQRENPHAFINGNINLIRAGQVMRVPSASEIRSVSSGEAFAETRRQNQEWREKQTVASASEDDEYAAAPAAKVPEDDGGTLKLVGDDFAAEGDDLASTASGAAAEGGDSVTGESGYGLSDSSDAADPASDTAIAAAKVGELESQLDDLKRLLTLKDQQLALLQASAKDVSGVQGGATDVADSEVSQPASSAAAEEKGLLVMVTENPIYIGIAILIFLAILVVMGALSRRKSEQDDYPVGLQNAIAEAETEVEFPDEFIDELDDDLAGQDAEEEGVYDEDVVAATTNSEGEAVRKAIEEAEIYIAYGRSERALEILQPAMDEYPENPQLVLKMAEICMALDDAEGLTRQEAKLQDIGDSDAIQQLQALKRSAQQAADAESLAEEAGEELDAGDDIGDDILAGADALDELDLGEELDVSPEQEPANRDNVVEFDSAAASKQETEIEPLEFSLDDLSADVDVSSEADDVAEADATELQIDEEEIEIVDHGDESGEDDFLGDTDESATKLELARAYIDMADQDAAEDILNEVIEEGSDEQKQKARQLLEGLG